MMHIAPVILANMASRVMWCQYSHLLYGNAIIGVLESIFLILVFKARPVRTFVLIIVANYVSMFCGLLIFGFMEARGPIHSVLPPTLHTYRYWLGGAVAISFLLTILIEWPFCFGSFSGERRNWGRALKACAITQVISYSVCIGLPYFSASEIRIAGEVSIEDAERVVPTGLPFRVYYIDPDNGDIYRMRPDGSQREHVMEVSLRRRSQLFVMGDLDGADARYDALWSLYAFDGGSWDEILIAQDFAPRDSAFLSDGQVIPGYIRMSFHDAAELREADDRDWRVRCRDNTGLAAGIRPPDSDSLDLGYVREEGDIHLSFTTGFGTWKGRNASVLPGDLVIFEFGGQICALDLNERKLALICFGYGPVVVRDPLPEARAD
jgi:hypothetical protein